MTGTVEMTFEKIRYIVFAINNFRFSIMISPDTSANGYVISKLEVFTWISITIINFITECVPVPCVVDFIRVGLSSISRPLCPNALRNEESYGN